MQILESDVRLAGECAAEHILRPEQTRLAAEFTMNGWSIRCVLFQRLGVAELIVAPLDSPDYTISVARSIYSGQPEFAFEQLLSEFYILNGWSISFGVQQLLTHWCLREMP